MSDIIKILQSVDGINSTVDLTATGSSLNVQNLKVLGSLETNLDMGENKITSLQAPTASGDAATKAYVDSAISSSSVTFTGILGEDMDGTFAVRYGQDGKIYKASRTYTTNYEYFVIGVVVANALVTDDPCTVIVSSSEEIFIYRLVHVMKGDPTPVDRVLNAPVFLHDNGQLFDLSPNDNLAEGTVYASVILGNICRFNGTMEVWAKILPRQLMSINNIATGVNESDPPVSIPEGLGGGG